MGNFLERLNILITENEAGKHTVFARNSGIKAGTFQNYINGRKPSFDALLNICETYNVNLNWLIAGAGPKYNTDQGEPQTLDPDPEIAELMEGARRVLTSGNPIAFDALERNIRYFDHAIAAEKRVDASEKELQEMKEDVAIIKKEMTKLKKQQCKDGKQCPEEQLPDEKVA